MSHARLEFFNADIIPGFVAAFRCLRLKALKHRSNRLIIPTLHVQSISLKLNFMPHEAAEWSIIMTREAIFEKLNEVFRDIFDDEDIIVTETTSAADIEEWDSLEHINLVVAVEKAFGIKFNMGEVVTMKNVGAMVDIIAERAE